MTEQELMQFLDDNRADIAASIKEKAVEAMTSSIRYQMPAAVTEAVATFFKDEIVPEIIASLKDQKGPIISASVKAAAAIGDAVAEKMVAQAVESMTGYRSGEVLKALMGVR